MINKDKLLIKSHGDELLKKVSEYFKKYPKITSTEPDSSTVELLKKLNDEVEFLERVLRNNPQKEDMDENK